MPRSSTRLALVAAVCLLMTGCTSTGDLQVLVAAGIHDDRAVAACIDGFPEGIIGDDNLAAAEDSTVASVRKLATSYSADEDEILDDADADEYAAVCVISGDLVREGKTTSNLAIYVLEGKDRIGELAAF